MIVAMREIDILIKFNLYKGMTMLSVLCFQLMAATLGLPERVLVMYGVQNLARLHF
jgi:hypothetical protein